MQDKIINEPKNIKRLKRILIILFENGFGYFIDEIGLKKFIPWKSRLKFRLIRLKPEQRIRITLEQLGPTFVKFGQLLSLRPDLLLPKYINELSKLQDNVPPFPFSEVQKQIKRELGKEIEEIFDHFEKKPFASASIAQVHKAKLNKKLVAVKIQRPNISEIMKQDIHIMMHLAKLLDKKKSIRKYQFVKIVQEFADWTEKELDFTIEAENARVIKNNFKGNESVVIPTVYSDYTTKKLLTLEFINGIKLKEIKRLKKEGFDLDEIIKKGFEAILTQVFIHGFFHADPHPGNIIITKDSKIAFVDFGIFGKLDEKLRKNCIRLFKGVITNNVDDIIESLLEIGSVKKEVDRGSLKEEIERIIEPLQNARIKDIKISRLLENILEIGLKYNIKMPIPLVLFGKTIATLEGVALEYDPNFKIVENSQTFIERLIKKEFSVSYMAKESMKTLAKFMKFMKDLPDQMSKALRTVQEGKVKIDVKDTDIKGLSIEIDKSSNRLSYGMVIAALIVAGALTVNVKMLTIFKLPMISFICFVFAAILGLFLIRSILSEKKVER